MKKIIDRIDLILDSYVIGRIYQTGDLCGQLLKISLKNKNKEKVWCANNRIRPSYHNAPIGTNYPRHNHGNMTTIGKLNTFDLIMITKCRIIPYRIYISSYLKCVTKSRKFIVVQNQIIRCRDWKEVINGSKILQRNGRSFIWTKVRCLQRHKHVHTILKFCSLNINSVTTDWPLTSS